MHLVRLLPRFLRGVLTVALLAESIASGFAGFLYAVAEGNCSVKSRAGAARAQAGARALAAIGEDEMLG